jgi:hypothetical protein
MPKKYCFVCGASNTYEGGNAPKFCSKCGKSLTLNGPNPTAASAVRIKNTESLEEIIEQRVQEALKKHRSVKKSTNAESLEHNEDEEDLLFEGEVPRPNKQDCVVNVPKFLTIADLQNKPDPITRENQQSLPDYSKE